MNWRKRLVQVIGNELAEARGAARALDEQAAQAAKDTQLRTRQALARSRKRRTALAQIHERMIETLTARTDADQAAAAQAVAECAAHVSPGAASYPDWGRWEPTPQGGKSPTPLLRCGVVAHNRELPALVGLRDRSHLAIADDATEALPGILLRALGSAPAGGVRLFIYDPEHLGGSLAAFAPLARAALAQFVGPSGLRPMLDDLVEDVRRINATVLAGEYSSLAELAASTGRRPEPSRLVVLLNSHLAEWSKEELAQLARLRRTGIAAGVHLVVLGSSDAEVGLGAGATWIHEKSTSPTGDLVIELDDPPPTDLITTTAKSIADNHLAGREPAQLVDLLPSEVWKESSATGLSVPIGEGSDGKLTPLLLGDNPPHALVGGPSGSGKTNLLYAWIGALTTHYSPDELELYLLDFKEGVSFARFASGKRDPTWLPHVRLVGVNINDDREFGLALLRHLKSEMRRRAEAAKQHEATKLEELREADPQGRWPRLVAVIDEFQALLEGRDAVTEEAVTLLEDLARRGRSQGIHLVLASQDVAGIEALWGRAGLVGQFTLRIALPKARRILADNNQLADSIPRFHAVVNDESGTAEANQLVAVPNAGTSAAWTPLQTKLWDRRPANNPPPTLFDGDDVPTLPDSDNGAPSTALVGQTIDVAAQPARLRLHRAPGRNLAVLGTRSEEACDVLASAVLSLARREEISVSLCCLDPDQVGRAWRLSSALADLGVEATWHDRLSEVTALWEKRASSQVHLNLVYAVDAGSSRLESGQLRTLRELLLHGPEQRFHTLGWWRSVPRLREDLGGFSARFDAIDAWLALDVQGPELAPLSPLAGGPAWYPRLRRGLFFDRAMHRYPEVLIPYRTDAVLPDMAGMLGGDA